jgi:hypothetical protein
VPKFSRNTFGLDYFEENDIEASENEDDIK